MDAFAKAFRFLSFLETKRNLSLSFVSLSLFETKRNNAPHPQTPYSLTTLRDNP